MSSKNTLFSYFKKVEKPVTPGREASAPAATEKKSEKASNEQDKAKNDENEKPKDSVSPPNKRTPKNAPSKESAKKKRKVDEEKTARDKGKKFKRIVTNDSSDEEESSKKRKVSRDGADWKPESESEAEELEESDESFSAEESGSASEREETTKKKSRASGASKKPAVKKSANTSMSSVSEKEANKAPVEQKVWAHMKYEFLKPEKIRDANKKKMDDPDYNPHTVFVPEDFKKNLTPAMRQWWDIKAKYFDSVIFIKLGKFYELYHMDATIGVNELNLIYMNHPEVAHAGFPEAAFARYSSALVERNYKVARVEQTETPDMMAERCKKLKAPTKFDKVVTREVCQVTTKGTRLYLAIEGDAVSEDCSYLISVTEGKSNENNPVFGVCFVDTSIGHFHIGQFEDDRHKSQLRMLLAQYPPTQVLLDKGRVSDETKNIFECVASSAIIEFLAHESEFLSPSACLTKLHENKYFECDDEGKADWPPVLAQLTSFADLRTPEPDKEIALSAFGGCLWYLINCKIDLQLINLRRFDLYKPELQAADQRERVSAAVNKLSGNMILDATTLQNLDVVENSETGEKEGSLFHRLDNCCTPFGRRLLRQWLCSPLCSISAIEKRQTAVSALMKMTDECDQVRKILKELPDLERLFMKIAVYGNALTAANHPESRAIFYSDFSKKKIGSFLALLKGFEKSLDVLDAFFDDGIQNSELLRKLTRCKESDEMGKFPDFKSKLEYFKKAFDPEDALKTGKITPRRGVDEEFEACSKELQDLDDELKDHLREVKNKLKCEVKYIGTDKKRFQIEIPEKVTPLPKFELSGSRKGFKRYYSPESKELLAKIQVAESAKKEHLLDINRKIFEKFSDSADLWRAAIECLAILDVLVAFAQYGTKEDTCMPAFEEPTGEAVVPYVSIKEGRLPTTNLTDFIPNDTVAGVDGKLLLLLTGPNMGGKSTLMRQFGLIVIMAQMGCPVPAEECKLTPVDRIFTRIGAQDHILAGESTFFVEMSETSSILKHATGRSIVLVDELGRGTTTFDGAAIASAVLESLVVHSSLTIFSTHYHFLVDKYADNKNVTLAHMACMEEDEEEEDNEANVEKVTLLYKLMPGACPSSYGFNAARLAGLPDALVLKAKQQAQKLQNHPKKIGLFAQLMGLKLTDGCNEDLPDIVALLKKQLHVA